MMEASLELSVVRLKASDRDTGFFKQNLTLASKWKGNRPNSAQRKEGCALVGHASVIESPIDSPSWPAEALDSM